jgi:hypothetical protein
MGIKGAFENILNEHKDVYSIQIHTFNHFIVLDLLFNIHGMPGKTFFKVGVIKIKACELHGIIKENYLSSASS